MLPQQLGNAVSFALEPSLHRDPRKLSALPIACRKVWGEVSANSDMIRSMSDTIKILSGIDAIRKRPGMYVGDPDERDGLHQLLWEVVSNCGDQVAAGNCDQIQIDLLQDDAVQVTDNGPGWLDVVIDGCPILTQAVTTLHPSASLTGHAPHDHVSKFGVGIIAVVALSEWCRIRTVRDGIARTIATRHGLIREPETRTTVDEPSGTTVTFVPDRQIFPDGLTWDSGHIQTRLREWSVLMGVANFQLRDHRTHTFPARQPLASLLPDYLPGYDDDWLSGEVSIDAPACTVNWTIRYRRHTSPHEVAFVNWQRISDSPHQRALKQALRSVLNATFGADKASAVRRHLSWVCQIRMQQPTFRGPTREVLTHPDLQRLLRPLLRRSVAAAIAERSSWPASYC